MAKYKDENEKYEFDFLECEVWQYHQMAQKTTILSDVDFVINAQDKVIFLEYKNAAVDGVVNPNAMLRKIITDKFYVRAAKKFYSTLFLHWACRKNEQDLPITYIMLIEHPEIDAKIRKRLKERITRQLPFQLKEEKTIKRSLIDRFEVLNMAEWHKVYPMFNAVPLIS